MTTKQERLDYPTGWLYLCQHKSVHFIIDALLQVDPKKEFNKTEFAEFAGVSRQSVTRHIDKLVELGVVSETTDGRRYHYNLESPVGKLIAELNGETVASSISSPSSAANTSIFEVSHLVKSRSS